jgi:SAM-dependent methyltransferase
MSEATDAHSGAIRDEFAHQADAFARSPTMSLAETLDAVVELVPVDAEARWLEVACGPGLIARAMAPRVGSVVGLDLTPAMVEKARAEAAAARVENVSFEFGDATALDLPDDSLDGAITRFSLHHIPAPVRALEEMRRVVRPGGYVVVADHVTDDDGAAAAWHEQIERLRDPSHWACLTPSRLTALGERAGLKADVERVVPFEIDFGEWLNRGSGGPANAELIERLLGEAPVAVESFVVTGEGDARRLALRNSLHRWRVPKPLVLSSPEGYKRRRAGRSRPEFAEGEDGEGARPKQRSSRGRDAGVDSDPLREVAGRGRVAAEVGEEREGGAPTGGCAPRVRR